MRALGIEPLSLDLADWHSARDLPGDVDAVVACPSASGDSPDAYRSAYVDVNQTLLGYARERSLRAYVYTGSTGVFGQSDGSEVNETTPPQPSGPSAEVLAQAERLVLSAHATVAVPAAVVRLSGLYGPGRTGTIERVRRGQMALGPGDDVWMNWCHLEDAARTILAILDHGRPAAVYHASDAAPARRSEVVTWIANRLAIESPRQSGDARDARGRRGANRRISALATRAELGIQLAFPSYREGLAPFLPRGWPAS